MSFKQDIADTSKIKEIVKKLKNLECPFIGSGEVAWVTEIMFKPNLQRYQLMEWMFSKMEYSVSKSLNFSVSEKLNFSSEGDGYQNSSEVKVKNLLHVISSFGLCGKDRSDVIEGVAPYKDQLNFWKLLVDILWKKYICSLQEDGSSSTSKGQCSILEQYEEETKYVNKLCGTVNLNHLFKEKLELFPDYHFNESKGKTCASSKSKVENLEEIKALAHQNCKNGEFKELFNRDVFDESDGNSTCNESIIPDEECLNKLEEDISSSVIELQRHANSGFNDAYKHLKLYLNVPTDESRDVGPSFQATNLEIQKFLKLKNAMSTLITSESELKSLNGDLQSFQVPSQPLSDSLLREHMVVLKELHRNPSEYI